MMGKAKWTKGPWIAKRRDGNALVIGTDDGSLEIAHVWEADDETDLPVEANANLIAASHALYEALDAALAFIAAWAGTYQSQHGLSDLHPTHKAAIEKTQRVLALARGETP